MSISVSALTLGQIYIVSLYVHHIQPQMRFYDVTHFIPQHHLTVHYIDNKKVFCFTGSCRPTNVCIIDVQR